MFVSTRAQTYASALWRAAYARTLCEPVSDALARALGCENLADVYSAKTLPKYTYKPHARVKVDAYLATDQTPLSQLMGRFIRQLLSHKCIHILPQIGQAYYILYLHHQGKIPACVRAAETLSPEQLKQIARLVKSHTGTPAEIVFQVVPELLGGFEVRTLSWRYDATLAGRLNRIRKRVCTLLETQTLIGFINAKSC